MRRLKAYTLAVILFLWFPLLFILWRGLAPEPFRKLWQNTEILGAFRSSLLLAFGSAFVTTGFGLATAFALPLLPRRAAAFLSRSLLIPLVLPEIAFGIAYLILFQKMATPLGWSTLLAAHVAFTFAYAVLILKTSVANLDASYVDAAKDLGAGPFAIFRHAVLPQLIPGIAAAATLAFSLSLDDFLITFFVKGIDQVTIPIKIFSMMRLRISEEVYALSVLLFGISLVTVVFVQVWFTKSQKS